MEKYSKELTCDTHIRPEIWSILSEGNSRWVRQDITMAVCYENSCEYSVCFRWIVQFLRLLTKHHTNWPQWIWHIRRFHSSVLHSSASQIVLIYVFTHVIDFPYKLLFLPVCCSVTPVENSGGNLIVCYIRFRNFNFHFFLRCSFLVLYVTEWYIEADV